MTQGHKPGLKWYWKRRPYQRLDGSISGAPRRRPNKAELGTGRRRFWQFRVSPRLRLLRRLPSPKKIISRIRDAYVNMMLSLAGSRACGAGYGYGGQAVAAFGPPKVREYDEKMLVEIYKTIMAKGQLFDEGRSAVSKVVIQQ